MAHTVDGPSSPSSGDPKHTPGPWAWMGNQHGIYLATTHSGRRYVMGFRRMGTQNAQPVFQVNQRMVPASDLVEFEVGDQAARGFAQGKADGSVYRYDIRGIDSPDARLIAAAPELLEALVAMATEFSVTAMAPDWPEATQRYALNRACEAIAKATGADGLLGATKAPGPASGTTP